MRIQKKLNNNVVVVKDGAIEKIVMGRGLAFNKKNGEEVDETIIDKVFTLSNKDTANKFQELIVDIPIDHVEIAEQIISYAKTQLGKKLNETLYISLVDHIYTAIERFLNGIVISNTLLWDIRRFYPDEFAIGLTALDMIEERFGLHLPDDEAGFIALHLVNAEIDENSVKNMYQITKVMQEVTSIVKYKFHIEFDEDNVYYYRFITHLKFFAQRLLSGTSYEDEKDDDLLNVVKKRYENAYSCVKAISNFIFEKYAYILSNEEELYLTIHIERVINKMSKY